jgi:uncharacterized membrane protein
MDSEGPAERRARYEQEQLSARGMRMLTGGITQEGDAFLIGAGAVLLLAALYPVVGAWAFLAFPVVFALALLVRAAIRRRRGKASRALSR